MATKTGTAAKNASATTKRGMVAKSAPAVKKSRTKNGVKPKKSLTSDERRAILYYLGADGKVVREVLNVPEPKRLSKFGEWRKAHPKGILKIIDMKAVMK